MFPLQELGKLVLIPANVSLIRFGEFNVISETKSTTKPEDAILLEKVGDNYYRIFIGNEFWLVENNSIHSGNYYKD